MSSKQKIKADHEQSQTFILPYVYSAFNQINGSILRLTYDEETHGLNLAVVFFFLIAFMSLLEVAECCLNLVLSAL